MIVDIDVLKDFFQRRVYHLTCCKELVQACALLACYDVFFRLRVFAIDVLRNGLVERDGHNHFVVVRAELCLLRPLHLADICTVEFLDLVVVEGHRELLVLVVHEVIMVLEPCVLLLLDDTFHELDGRIVLADIALPLCLDDNLLHGLRIGLKFDSESAGCSLCDVYLLLLITHAGEGKRCAVDTRDGKESINVGYSRSLTLFV